MRLILLSLLLVLIGACNRNGEKTVLEFWAMGREGEAVQSLMSEFERRHPAIRVKVQQIPWSAAHEKLLTAYAGDAMPDVFQLGNTWIPEFVVLNAVDSLDDRLTAEQREDYFQGILETNEIDGKLYGLPWYVDTRLLFYRTDILAEAGFTAPPKTWNEWLVMMARVKALSGGERYAVLLPMNEWQVPVILGLQFGAELLQDEARFGNFQSDAFRRAFRFYLDIFRQGYAPAVSEAQVANLYQEFATGYFVMYVTGPWNIGEFERRLPKALQDKWATAPMPAPDENYPGPSLAGGASLAIARSSDHKDQAWKLIEFLSQPEQQLAFYRLTGDLPPRRSAWRHPDLATAVRTQAFKTQLERVVSTPKIPEWERIASKIAHYAEKAVRGELTEERALAALDEDVNRILEKRRWLLRKRAP
ncbi:sugar ABC transporter substrate-binding protein [Methylocaldum szegediense]|uniref:Multiple sugar transport system substrate-binding protein n=1 Tax=Methylocaldum szegediense TaxID=73780 RepID=A0ABM9I9L4_9GAMM|nr:sugar ABC transporter substrate-binding protein [Methylocaldum szegediense]CAI8976253.1 multiple sugar transport system substrate-binding protein [Methylocaldum szegediense]